MSIIQTASQRASALATIGILKWFGLILIAAGAIYADVLFYSIISPALPGGIVGAAANTGAFLTSASLIALTAAKMFWIRPGLQSHWAWAFTWIEIAICAANVTVAFMKATGAPLGPLQSYLDVCAAMPFVSVIGWIMVLTTDPDIVESKEEKAMEAERESANRQHKIMAHTVALELKATTLQQSKQYMQQHLARPEVQDILSRGAYDLTMQVVGEVIGHPVLPGLPSTPLPEAKKIDADKEYRPHPDAPGQNKIDTSSRPHATKRLPRQRKFTPRQQPAAFVKEVEVSRPPLASQEPQTDKIQSVKLPQRRMLVKRQEVEYVVNRPKPLVKLND